MTARCGIAKVLTAMTAEDGSALKALLNAPIPANAVSRELEAAGFVVSYQIIYRHRVGTCSCEDSK